MAIVPIMVGIAIPVRLDGLYLSLHAGRFPRAGSLHFSGRHRFRGFNRLRRTNFAESPFVPPVNRRRLRSRVFLNRTLTGSSRIARGDRTGFGVRRTNFSGAVRVRNAAVSSVTPVFGGGNRRAGNGRRVGTGSRNIVRNRGNQSRRSRIFLSRGNANSNSIVFDRESRTFTNGPAATTSNSRSQSRRARQLRQGRVSSQAGSTSPSSVRSSRSRRNSNLNTRPGRRESIQGRSRRGSSRVVLRSNQDRDSRSKTTEQDLAFEERIFPVPLGYEMRPFPLSLLFSAEGTGARETAGV